MEPVTTKTVKQKQVAVRYTGPIIPLGGIYGPTVPQIMDVSIIATLLIKGYRVVEVLSDGREIQLNMGNYNVDNEGDGGKHLKAVSKPNEEIKPIPKPGAKKPEEKPAEQEPVKPVEETPKDEEQKQEVIPTPQQPAQNDNISIKVGGTAVNAEEKSTETVSDVSVNNGQYNGGKKDKHNKNNNQQQSTSMSKADKLVSK